MLRRGKMKKIIIALIILAMVLSVLIPVLSFTQSSYLSSARTLERLGILRGYSSGSLGVNDYLKRQDMVVLISRLYSSEDIARNSLSTHNFTDIKNSFYDPYIGWAVSRGLINGRSATIFGYNQYVTMQEFQTVLLRVLNYNEEAQLWNTVPQIAARLGLMRGVRNSPRESITRGQLSHMVLNSLSKNQKGSTLTLGYVLGLDF